MFDPPASSADARRKIDWDTVLDTGRDIAAVAAVAGAGCVATASPIAGLLLPPDAADIRHRRPAEEAMAPRAGGAGVLNVFVDDQLLIFAIRCVARAHAPVIRPAMEERIVPVERRLRPRLGLG